jgi:hypothetical protein
MTVSDILNPPSGTVSGHGDDGEYSQPGPKRCECGQCWFDGKDWLVRSCVETRDMSVCGEYVVQHCPGKCGARFTLTETGEVQVGKPYAELEEANSDAAEAE